ncbi:MAG: OsmC family peroxiredoxin [Gemmatimonadota bacterium]
MIEQTAQAIWRGGLTTGGGSLRSGTIDSPYSYASRFEGASGTTPEELIAAALAGCFSMALSLFLGKHGHTPGEIRTTATVQLEPGQLAITGVRLETEAEVPGLGQAEFLQLAMEAKQHCPVSKALKAVPITLQSATLSPARV